MRSLSTAIATFAILLAGCNSESQCDQAELKDPIVQDVRFRAEVVDGAGEPLSDVPIALEGFKTHCMGDVESFGPFEGLTDSQGAFEPGITLTLKMDNGLDAFALAAYEPATYQKLGEAQFSARSLEGRSTLVVPVVLDRP